MRIVKELNHEGIKITCFQLEHKYLVKYEVGPAEITYKFKIGPGLESTDELVSLINNHLNFVAPQILNKVQESREEVIQDFFSEEDSFPEII